MRVEDLINMLKVYRDGAGKDAQIGVYDSSGKQREYIHIVNEPIATYLSCYGDVVEH